MNPSKVDVVLHWETLKSIFEIISFLCLAGYYWKFIEGFSKLDLLLMQSLGKDKRLFGILSVKRVFKS